LPYLLAIVAGNFIYLAFSDLVPIIHHGARSKNFRQIIWFLIGVMIIYLFKIID